MTSALAPSMANLRNMDAAALESLGQECLREHLCALASVAHLKFAPLQAANLEALLRDPQCLRHPVRLAFEFGEMAMHQFAQPDIDWRNTGQDGRVLYLRPLLRDRPDLLPLAVAYMIPVINYGAIVSDDHCLAFGATLFGMTEEEYHGRLCAMCDELGAEARPRPYSCDSAIPSID